MQSFGDSWIGKRGDKPTCVEAQVTVKYPRFHLAVETWVGRGRSFIDGGDVNLLDEGHGWEGTGGSLGRLNQLVLIPSRIGWR